MARKLITNVTDDMQDDSGAVLFSIIQGEQLEFPVTLSFVENASQAYEYECVIMEALNVSGQTEPPVVAKNGGVSDALVVWTPPWKGEWSAAGSYSRDDLVLYGTVYYLRLIGADEVSATPPNLDTAWKAYTPNVVYIRFPESLSSNWGIQPTTESNIYGFIELRVEEPFGGRYPRTWKPLRGMIEFLYSPTHLVN